MERILMHSIDLPNDMDLEQYIATQILDKLVENKELKPQTANFMLRKGLGLDFDYFEETY